MKKNQELLVKFKSDLFKIGAGRDGSERLNNETSYKLFIDYALKSTIQALYFVPGFAAELEWNDSVQECLDNPLDTPELDQAVKSYRDVVRANAPFTDVFSMLHEELLLSGRRGEGLGAYYAPMDISDVIAQLMPLLSSDKSVFDMCSGAGSLDLAPLKRCALENPDALGSIPLILADIDEFACKVAFVQIASNMLLHCMRIGVVAVYNCNLITDWLVPGKLMICYKAPESVVISSIRAGQLKAFNEVMDLCKDSSEDTRNAVTI